MTDAPATSSRTIAPSHLFLGTGLLALVLAVVLVVPTMLAGKPSGAAALAYGPSVGSIAPDFRLQDALTGKSVDLASLRGKPVWLNFWASWCSGCKQEMPDIQKLYAQYSPQGLQVIGINVQESANSVRDFTAANNFRWTFLLDTDGRVTDRYYVNGLPYHVFIGTDGIIDAIYPGQLGSAEMEGYIGRILK
ncbi:MAG: TlpA disulfide reductase family protein [Chloroflexota bacterium]